LSLLSWQVRGEKPRHCNCSHVTIALLSEFFAVPDQQRELEVSSIIIKPKRIKSGHRQLKTAALSKADKAFLPVSYWTSNWSIAETVLRKVTLVRRIPVRRRMRGSLPAQITCPSQLPSLSRRGAASGRWRARCQSQRPGPSRFSSVLIKTRRDTRASPH
jgi:hypothetical protein